MKLVEEFGIAENPAIKALWEKRERWIPTYFKGMYCGRMTSTQRSESQNRVIKDGFVNENTSLHMFAKRMLDALQHADHMDAGETHYAQVKKIRKTLNTSKLQYLIVFSCYTIHMITANC